MRCLNCKKTVNAENFKKFQPFCSARCKSLDLADWLSETNKISEPLDMNSED
jgi:endogenous inhibitor of DNA gyrase (YacG/DUF329 family)|tara:strand:+ start:195 stop:350 length:156 start_codon:yes stop_codon:yes gene_type:complete